MDIPPKKPTGLQDTSEVPAAEPVPEPSGTHKQGSVRKKDAPTSSGIRATHYMDQVPLAKRKADELITPEEFLKKYPERFIIDEKQYSPDEVEKLPEKDRPFIWAMESFRKGNFPEATGHFVTGKELGCTRCMNNLGLLTEEFSQKKYKDQVRKLYEAAWEKGCHSQAAYNLGLHYKGTEDRDARIYFRNAVFEGHSSACKEYADLLGRNEMPLKLFYLYLGWKLGNGECHTELLTFCDSKDPEVKMFADFFSGRALHHSVRRELEGIAQNFHLHARSWVRAEVKDCIEMIPPDPVEPDRTQPDETVPPGRKRAHFAAEDKLTETHFFDRYEQEEDEFTPPESKKKKR